MQNSEPTGHTQPMPTEEKHTKHCHAMLGDLFVVVMCSPFHGGSVCACNPSGPVPWKQESCSSVGASVILVEQCSKPPSKGENSGGTPASMSFYCLNKITERHVVCRLHPCVIIGTKDWEFKVVIIREKGHSPITASSLSLLYAV